MTNMTYIMTNIRCDKYVEEVSVFPARSNGTSNHEIYTQDLRGDNGLSQGEKGCSFFTSFPIPIISNVFTVDCK